MNQFYYVDASGSQVGPVSKQELKSRNISRQTLVWCEGMSAWTPAGSVTELNEIFAVTPPVIPTPQTPQIPSTPYETPQQGHYGTHQKPNSYMWLGLVTTILCCLPLGLVSIYFASKVDTCMAQGDYDGAVTNSNNARLWGIISAIVGFLASFFIIVIGLVG